MRIGSRVRRAQSYAAMWFTLFSAISESFEVGRFLFVEGPAENSRAIRAAEFFRPGDQAAVPGDLVMLDRLRRGHQRRVEHARLGFRQDIVGFLQDAVDRWAAHPARFAVVQLEYFLQPSDMPMGLLEVRSRLLRKASSLAFSTILGSAFSICFSA